MGYRKLGLLAGHRRSVLRNGVTSFLLKGRIMTTETRAKELQRIADKMITLAKRGDLHARRQALDYLLDESAVKNLFDNIGPRYGDRQGGYTRLMKVGIRRGDGSTKALLELV